MKSLGDIKRKLSGYSYDEILFDRHAELRIGERQVKKKLIIHNLRNPENLTDFKLEKAHNPKKTKVVLYFKLSNSRSLYLVVILTDNLIKVKTCNIDNRRYKKKIRRGRWQK